MSGTTQSTGGGRGGVPTEFKGAGEQGGAEGRVETLGQKVEVIWDSVPGARIQGEVFKIISDEVVVYVCIPDFIVDDILLY